MGGPGACLFCLHLFDCLVMFCFCLGCLLLGLCVVCGVDLIRFGGFADFVFVDSLGLVIWLLLLFWCVCVWFQTVERCVVLVFICFY